MGDFERKPGRIVVSVTDQGAGIAPDHQRNIFEKRDVATGDPSSGTRTTAGADSDGSSTSPVDLGPDLSTVAMLARRLHGQISLRSTVGTGSTVTVELPLDQ